MSLSLKKTAFILFCVFINITIIPTAGHSEEPLENSSSFYQAESRTNDYTYRPTNQTLATPKESWSTRFFLLFSRKKTEPVPAAQGPELNLRVQDLVSQLLANSSNYNMEEESITVCTFVNLNHLYTTSGLGRYLGEQMIYNLRLAGLDVFDVRITPAMLIKQGVGEYGMSRDMAELTFVHPGSATVVGTYTFTDNEIFINARLLRNSDGKVLSAASTVFAMNRISTALLADEARPARRGTAVAIKPFTDLK